MLRGVPLLLLFWGAFLSGGSLQRAPQPFPFPADSGVELIVLGSVQDGGSPHIGCSRACCAPLYQNPDPSRKVVALGLIDRIAGRTFLIEAGPDFPEQLRLLQERAAQDAQAPSGIFLTHAHIGHYSGLMYLGREALGADSVPVYAMPRMLGFLKENGPWSQLVSQGNIALHPLEDSRPTRLTPRLEVVPFRVPHRDEFSETVGFEIRGPGKTALFIPDIDKWERWKTDIVARIRQVDLAFLDASFYDANEVGYRDMSEIPHPFVVESLSCFDSLPDAERRKIRFIHLNHTNPLLDPSSDQSLSVQNKGYGVARFGETYGL